MINLYSMLPILALLFYYLSNKNLSIFKLFPAVVMLYLTTMVLNSLGLWEHSVENTRFYKELKHYLLPAMIFWLLLQSNITAIASLGKKMLLAYSLSFLSIVAGFIGMFLLLKSHFSPQEAKAFGALCGSWLGGSVNMLSVQEALGLKDADLGYVMLIDSINYALWVALLLSLVGFASPFNRWTKSTLLPPPLKSPKRLNLHPLLSYMALLLLGAAAVATSYFAAAQLPHSSWLSKSAYAILIATLLGIAAAQSPLSRLGQSGSLGNMALFIIVALIGSRVNLSELHNAPLYIAAGFIILLIHGVLMILFAKLFRLDLFSIAVASLANIGGVASAPLLASSYNQSLIPIGILMAMIGYTVGTFGGLTTAYLLQSLY